MEKRHILNKEISLLGFGLMRLPKVGGNFDEIDYEASTELIDYAIKNGINYFDTAYTYGGSEAFAGHVLSNYPRETYYLATKCPPWKIKDSADFERIFAEQLERCKTDYFDFYLVHNLAEELNRAGKNDEYFENFVKIGMRDMLEKKKQEGKIKHIGFSFHGTLALFQKLLDRYEWDFAQIQLNYVDWKAIDAKAQYEMLTEYGIPITVMEPLRGGTLANLNETSVNMLKQERPDASIASWGIRFAASFPNVLTVLSGMNSMEQLIDNISTTKDFVPVTGEEKDLLYRAATLYSSSGAIPCTGCRYCMPCPVGVDIPTIFSVYNHYKTVNFRIPFDNGYATLSENEKASACVKCEQCVLKCPQHLTIPEYLQEIDDFVRTPSK